MYSLSLSQRAVLGFFRRSLARHIGVITCSEPCRRSISSHFSSQSQASLRSSYSLDRKSNEITKSAPDMQDEIEDWMCFEGRYNLSADDLQSKKVRINDKCYVERVHSANECVRQLLNMSVWDEQLVGRVYADFKKLVPSATDRSVDHSLLTLCRDECALRPARLLLAARQSAGISVPVATCALYIDLCGRYFSRVINCSTTTDTSATTTAATTVAAASPPVFDMDGDSLRQHALQLYESRLAVGVLDFRSLRKVLLGLCRLGYWRVALRRRDQLRHLFGVDTVDYSLLACMAMRAGAVADAQRLVQLLLDELKPVSFAVLYAWLLEVQRRALFDSRSDLIETLSACSPSSKSSFSTSSTSPSSSKSSFSTSSTSSSFFHSSFASSSSSSAVLDNGVDSLRHSTTGADFATNVAPAVSAEGLPESETAESGGAQPLFDQLMQYLLRFNMPVSDTIASHMLEICTQKLSRPWHGQSTFVSNSGVCKHCGSTLPRAVLSDSEFSALRDAFFSQVLIGDDVYLSSTPPEVMRFRDFVRRNAPFDHVVDGLNIMHASGSKTYDPHMLGRVVNYLSKQDANRILVIGRPHMLRNREVSNFVRSVAQVFLLNDMSADDSFLIYALLHSTQRTRIYSCDMMRREAKWLQPALKHNFFRLMRSNRVEVRRSLRGKSDLRILMPYSHDLVTQHDGAGGWHVPHQTSDQLVNRPNIAPPPNFTFNNTWLCLKAPTP